MLLIMKKLDYKVFIAIISLFVIFFTKSEINWVDLKSNYISMPIIKEILYDLSVGIFSAMFLIFTIDEVSERNKTREEKKRTQAFYMKLIPSVEAYYDFYVKLYIATRADKVFEDESILKSLFNDKKRFVEQIMKAEPFYKEGFYADGSINFFEYMDRYNEPPKSFPWYKCLNIDNSKFTASVRKLEQDYVTLIPTELLSKLDILMNLTEPLNNISNFIEMRHTSVPQIIHLPINFILESYRFLAILDALENVMQYIQIESGVDILSIEINYINERNTSPILGSALK